MANVEEKADVFEDRLIQEGVKSTKALIQTLLQTMKAYRLYDSNHPVLTKYLDRLKKDFDHYFDEFDSFSLQVGEHKLFYLGKVVYESEDVKESLAFLFYKDGIREIQFFRGLQFKEVVDFLEIVRKADFVNRMEDDLVTLIWEKDFSHITITTLDEFLEEGASLVPASMEDLDRGLEYKPPEAEAVEEKAEEKEAEEAHVVEAEGLKEVLSPPPGYSLVQACQLTADEIEEIRRKVEREHEPDYISVLIDNLIEILLHLGEDMDAYENMISYFERTIESFLEQKEVAKAVMILNSLSGTMESIALKDKQIFAVRRILETMSGARPVQFLGKMMKSNGEKESESITQYLQLLTRQAVDPLCQLLIELDSARWRRTVSDHLAELCRQDIQPLSKFLSNPNPFAISQILYVLGKIGHPQTAKYLKGLVTHADPRVREETLQLLGKLGEKGKELVLKFLNDPSPSIRAKASLILARIVKEEAVKPLLQIVLSEDFYKRDLNEKASFFRALSETGSKEVIPILEKIAKTKRWFQKGKWDEMRLCAANALKFMATGQGTNPSQVKGKPRGMGPSPQ
ncbi:MAG: HEAT repeat domain-containing protein [Syntrophaceae bacterium]|nr:HEAT repeat domain-containing protein [Syntrophaceae bacterium]